MTKTTKSVPISSEKQNLRQVSSSTCQTLSEASTLNYSISVDPAGASYLRIVGNDGGGFFSRELIALKDIRAALEKAVPVTSSSLTKLFKRKSANTPGFLLAVLVHLKLVEPLPDKTRQFKLLDPAPFLDRVAKLTKSTKPAAPKPAKKTAAKKSPPKKKAKK